MIEPPASVSPPAPAASGPGQQAAPGLPVRPRTGRVLVLAGAFVCAACGLVYELELVALASSLMGDSVTQTSVVLSLMVFAMGAGSLGAKRLRPYAVAGFGAVEAALALVGGCSGMGLYAVFAWGDGCGWESGPHWLLVLCSLTIGVLTGAEVPLLMVLIQRVRRQDAGTAVADLFAADYVGALVGGLAFPFLLLPLLGQLTGALLTGAVNALAGGALALGLLRRDMSPRSRRVLLVVTVLVLVLLATAATLADDFERAARRAVYGDDIRIALHTDVEEVVLTGGPRGPLKLFLDGRLRVRSRDEPRYHSALVTPAACGPLARVLVLGGDDGLAAGTALRRAGVHSVDVVALDPGVVRLARTDPALSALNERAFRDPRVHVATDDPFDRLRHLRRRYDLIVSDLPGPGGTASTKYYSQEFYGLVRRALAPGGRFVVRAGRSGAPDRAFWTVDATLRAAGLTTTPYRAGRWGFVLAAHGPGGPKGVGGPGGWGPGVRSVAGARPAGTVPSTLVHPRYGG
ncbi:polyamine aminopropyltransferase 2 [Streptomyces sulfonofaciens]|uniref:Polyamine aminopropyltransferase 2 n=1 Tax=Streptomyces sulfonofaciens TaxID=68272 RepID=A0A919FPX7_9ACTN|nr:polyamine aminopropyltransferase [Streptomyces sulfonofaciens]GHH69495.1 polyamine aminopropyltransferase 2 [Streptomyces sulfonofaciens]